MNLQLFYFTRIGLALSEKISVKKTSIDISLYISNDMLVVKLVSSCIERST